MIKFSPSILSADFANLERDIRMAVDYGAEYIHVDVMDGMFVPNITIGAPVVKALRKVTDAVLDVHLMINEPIRYVEDFAKAGADIITIHYEADTFENIVSTVDKIKELGCKVGVAVKPDTPGPVLLAFMDIMDLALIMTVEPGFGGQSFMERMLPKIQGVRAVIDANFPHCELEVDGGINIETAKLVKEAGANVLVAGSAFFGAKDKKAFIDSIKA